MARGRKKSLETIQKKHTQFNGSAYKTQLFFLTADGNICLPIAGFPVSVDKQRQICMNGDLSAGVGAHAVAVNVLSEKGGKQEKGQPQSGRTGYNAQIQTAVGRIRLGRKAEAAALIFLNMRGNETDLLQIDSFDAVEKKITAAAFAENDPFDPDQQVSQLSNMKLVEALFQFCGEKILAYIRVISDPGADNKASVGRIVRHIRQNPVINISELVGF